MTDTVYILTNDTFEQTDSILVSTLVTDALYIHMNDTIDKFRSTSVSIFIADTASILMNDVIKDIDSVLASSLVTDAVNIDPLPPISHLLFTAYSSSFSIRNLFSQFLFTIEGTVFPSSKMLRFPVPPPVIGSKHFTW